MQISVDFSKNIGLMKEVNGVNSAPYNLMREKNQARVTECLTELHTTLSRTHDVMYPYGSNNFVDVPNIFRDFDADENDENNYDFHYTDEFLAPIVACGTKIYYRLGISIEWGSKKYRTYPPKDFAKWARICEHIIMHYNEGWANGFHYGIEYWEIWNEPENPPMWSGTIQEFFDLYKVAACYLKSRFPEIKVGGFGSCGFYAITTRKESPFFLKCLNEWYRDFLVFVKKENAPLDFFSWHLYTDSFEEFCEHAKFVRESLDEYGFKDTEAHFNEWNIGGEGAGFPMMRNMTGASYIARVLIEMQNTRYVDKAMYYSFENRTAYNGLFDQNTYFKTPTYFAMQAFGDCYALKNQVEASSNNYKIGVVAAANGGECSAVIANYHSEEDNDGLLTLKGLPIGKTLAVKRLTFADGFVCEEQAITASQTDIDIKMEKGSVIQITVK